MNEKCFALYTPRKCSILTDGVCHGNYSTCPFYKPKWMAKRDYERSLTRISSKPDDVQRWISEKYYQGKMPWLKGEPT